MSVYDAVQAPAYPWITRLKTILLDWASHRASVYIVCTVAALAANYVVGADMAWDTVDYQLYAGFSALNDRFAQDYFAAGPQSYFNPYAYVPFYALVKAGLSALEISSVLALFHSMLLWLTFELALCVCPTTDRRLRMAYGICAVALTFVNPILIQQIGSSYADITTAELALAGWLLLAQAARAPKGWKVACAGLLLGFAAGLKPTNAVHAIGACAVLFALPLQARDRIRQLSVYSGALAAGFAIVAAPWSYHLEQRFGNPVFPLMNGLFRSPDFTTEPLRHFRFIPESFANALWRPFAMVDPVPMVQEELAAPDLRYALLIVLVGLLFAIRMKRGRTQSATPAPHTAQGAPTRLLAALGAGLTVDWILWLNASGNGRYFLPMASVVAVMIVALVFKLFGARPKVRNYVLITIFGAQIIQLCFGANTRWNWVPWSDTWLDVQVPAKLAAEPNLYLTVGVQSNSFIAPFLAKGSGLVNFSGGYALRPDGANGTRIHDLMQTYGSHVRVLWRSKQPDQDAIGQEPRRRPVDDPLRAFGLRVDSADCDTITVRGLPPESEITINNSTSTGPAAPADRLANDTSYLVSCHVVADDSDRSALLARQHAVDLVLDHLEDACPALFQPRRLRTEHNGEIWRRLYINTDLVALVGRGTVKLLNPVRGGQPTVLGSETDWLRSPPRLVCGRRHGYYFASVLNSKPAR